MLDLGNRKNYSTLDLLLGKSTLLPGRSKLNKGGNLQAKEVQ